MKVSMSPAQCGAAAVLISFLAIVSCGGGEKAANEMAEKGMEKAMKSSTGKDTAVQLDGKSVKIKQEGLTAEMTETSQWPSDMFAEVPEFTFGKVVRVSKGEDNGMMKFNIYFNDLDPEGPDKYATLLKSAGWQANVMKMGPRGAMITGQKGDIGMNFMIGIEKREGMLAVFRTSD